MTNNLYKVGGVFGCMAVKKSDGEYEEEVDETEAKKSKKSKGDKEPELTDLPGIGPAVAVKLESAGIFDLMALAVSSPATISDAAGVSPAVARKAIMAARDLLDLGFTDGIYCIHFNYLFDVFSLLCYI